MSRGNMSLLSLLEKSIFAQANAYILSIRKTYKSILNSLDVTTQYSCHKYYMLRI